MKKNFFYSLLFLIGIISSVVIHAQTFDNFNSRPSVSLNQIKAFLEDHCSLFVGFDINAGNWNPQIEGDGAMVSENSPSPSYGLSPVLILNGSITISFSYKFNNTLTGGERRWLKISLADENNIPQLLLDSIEYSNFNTSTIYTYNKTHSTPIGNYKLFVSYNGMGGSAAIAIDQLHISASKYYNSGCNFAPVAVNDNINGSANRSASGNVLTNDTEPNGEQLSAYLMTASPHGNLIMNANGSFSFSPNAGFNGSSTSFTYKICDNGLGVLCSNDGTVTINFPSNNTSILPLSLTDFNGVYRNEGKVELNWVTNFEQNVTHFEVERSFDGIAWQKVGALQAQGVSAVKKSYSFTDEAGRNTAIKRDLYYRLKQIDADSRSAYSRILIVRVYNTHSIKMISVTPNPAVNDIAVNIQLNEGSYIVMKVVSSNGVEVIKKSIKASAGANSYTLEGTRNLQRGMYLLEVIINSKERMVVKLMKE
jgi:hypothetical protein